MLEQQTWRYDADVATSLRAWVLEHGDWVWMYQENRSGKPVFNAAQDDDQPNSATEPPDDSFQLGFSTPRLCLHCFAMYALGCT